MSTPPRLPGFAIGTLGDTCKVKDVCEVYDMTAPTVRGLCREQIITAKKRGGKWQIDTESVKRLFGKRLQ